MVEELNNDLSSSNLHLLNASTFEEHFRKNLKQHFGTDIKYATPSDLTAAFSLTLRKFIIDRWQLTRNSIHTVSSKKTVAYLSAEYLLGPFIKNILLVTGLEKVAEEAMHNLGLSFASIVRNETEPALGNGGLGRLAACYMDSLATLEIPAVGYGIRYEHGLFRQVFNEFGEQVEVPDYWLDEGNPWEQPVFSKTQRICFGGHTEKYLDGNGEERTRWVPEETIRAIPYNYYAPGYKTGCVNTLRLWEARGEYRFNLKMFNEGRYEAAVNGQNIAAFLSKVLYPGDSTPQGKELRLRQQYFFVSASIKDAIRSLYGKKSGTKSGNIYDLPKRIVFQLNDTHPVIGIPEMMRILIDRNGLAWDEAWKITKKCFNYTCHTLLPEALEVWETDLFGRLLPRHLEIIYEINRRHIEDFSQKLPDAPIDSYSIIQETPTKAVRMAYLATVGSTHVNGVASLHSDLIKQNLLPAFYQENPKKFKNVTNGVTPRRFLRVANRRLSNLITEYLGNEKWVKDLSRIKELENYVDDANFIRKYSNVRKQNKKRFAEFLLSKQGISVKTDAIYDVMIKRLHEYKRQMLKILQIITLYNKIKKGELKDLPPIVFIFGAKAAPEYEIAKDTIRLINAVSETIKNDPVVSEKLQIVFVENYNVTWSEYIIPAADISEQISLAGLEASGTSNMKLSMNGALTIGTYDGANIEILKEIGQENFFLFGMKENEVSACEKEYNPRKYYDSDPDIKEVIDTIASGIFSGGYSEIFNPIVEYLLNNDRFMCLADYKAYMDATMQAYNLYQDNPTAWRKKSILSVARSSYFSSDRAIKEYIDNIWKAKSIPLKEPIYYINDVKFLSVDG